ncbi:beta-ketoacyl synthase N-terminal-like domain-containing protein [Streptomyces sp. NRRL F-5727]|uniref:beta-ketoacyl synthase N-terminal-like domain-containing protein n=1 Tax=Streptomyces sp. NRRL F-5727 TaxID=1463871 RepID=UPI000559D349|nr:beta-ketoacyl synthase N-terminal-like domain-containing protein [Streptomyces sp. NRRL F-5727]
MTTLAVTGPTDAATGAAAAVAAGAAPLPGAVPLDIVGAGVFSAAGPGLAALAGPGVASAGAAPDADGSWPPLPVLGVTGFDAEAVLGRKGLRGLSRTDRLAMAACLAAATAAPADAGERTGIVLGTDVGSTAAQADFFRDTFTRERPYLVNPSAFPGTLMNSAAGRTAIRLGLTGLNATVSGGALASLHALRYARNALVNGHADRLLVGGVEEASAAGAWAWHRAGALRPGAALGEGCAVLVLRDGTRGGTDGHAGGGEPLGRLLACETGYADPVAEGPLGVAGRLAECVRTALLRSGLTGDDERPLVVPGAGARRGWAAVELRALREVFGPLSASRVLRVDGALGETHAASGALRLAAVLARWQAGAGDERAAVLTAVGQDGSVGAAVVTRPAHS